MHNGQANSQDLSNQNQRFQGGKEPHTFKDKTDELAEDFSPLNPMSYAMVPSALNSPKFLSDVGPGFEFSLKSAKTYAFTTFFGLSGVPFFFASLLRRL